MRTSCRGNSPAPSAAPSCACAASTTPACSTWITSRDARRSPRAGRRGHAAVERDRHRAAARRRHGARARTGAIVIVDGAQGAAHLPPSPVGDFYACSGHKLYGPGGTGILWAKPRRLEELAPWRTGGGMVARVDYQHARFRDPPARFEAWHAERRGRDRARRGGALSRGARPRAARARTAAARPPRRGVARAPRRACARRASPRARELRRRRRASTRSRERARSRWRRDPRGPSLRAAAARRDSASVRALALRSASTPTTPTSCAVAGIEHAKRCSRERRRARAVSATHRRARRAPAASRRAR